MPEIRKISYTGEELEKILRSNKRGTGLPPDPNKFLQDFIDYIKKGKYLEAVLMFFDLRLQQLNKILKELEGVQNTERLKEIYMEIGVMRGTELVGRLEPILSDHWKNGEKTSYRFIEIAFGERDKSISMAINGFKRALEWFLPALLREKARISKQKFTIEVSED